ncbi:MAG: fibronectin type III domain-containing protein [Prevotellaceae bacterium]|jgi:hypothetical protein|nr:fibronectin type III domain-containing protein [Prevotellaceae bacterium]
MNKNLLRFGVMILSIIIVTGVSAQRKVFRDGFESGLTQWSQTPVFSTDSLWSVGEGIRQLSAVEGSNYAYLCTDVNQPPVKLISPPVDLSTLMEPALTFSMAAPKFANGDRDTLKIYAKIFNGEWQLLETYTATTQGWTDQSVNLAVFENQAVVTFAFEYNYGLGKGVAIDNVEIGATQACATPYNLLAQRITNNSATLLWSSGYAESYRLKVSTTQITDFSQTANTFDNTVYSTARQITGLFPTTKYYFYVQADCGGNDFSEWSQAGTFTTDCTPRTLPYTENFTSVSTGNLPSCWKTITNHSGDWGEDVPAAQYTPHCEGRGSGNNMALFLSAYYYFVPYLLPLTTSAYAISPALGTDLSGYQLSFKLYSANRTKLHVGVLLDPQDITTFVELSTFSVAAGVSEDCIIPLTAAPAGYNRITFFVDASDINNGITGIYIDDINVSLLPSCSKPSILRATVTENSASLSWTGTASSYHVRVSSEPIDYEYDSGDIFDGTVSTVPFSVSSLDARTTYYFYVQADCGSGVTSEWSNQGAFMTAAIPATMPYNCSFGDAVDNKQWELENGTQANKWVIGAGAHNGGPSGLYISDNAMGTTNSYNTGSTSYVYAIRKVNLHIAGSYFIQFDWKAQGQYDTDLMRVFLTPAATELSAGNAFGLAGDRNLLLDDWINAVGDQGDHGKLVMSPTWTTQETVCSVATPGIYNLVFFWKNDNQGGTQPPVAVDNIFVDRLLCRAVDSLTASNVTGSSASITWTDKAAVYAWNVKLSTVPIDPSVDSGDVFNGTVTSKPYVPVDLSGATKHYVYVQANCDGPTSAWKTTSFTTECGGDVRIPYRVIFTTMSGGGEEITVSKCWKLYSGRVSDIFNGGFLSSPIGRWGISSNANVIPGGDYHAYVDVFTATTQRWMISPPIALNRAAELSFDLVAAASTTGATFGLDEADDQFMVLISAEQNEGRDVWKESDATIWNNKGTGKYVYSQIPTTATKITIPLNQYRGKTVKVAFYAESTIQGGHGAAIHVGNVIVDTLSLCEPPVVTVDSIGKHGVRVTWIQGSEDPTGQLVYGAKGFDPTTGTPVAVGASPHVLVGLTEGVEYDLYLRSKCTGDTYSAWSAVTSFETVSGCPPPTNLTGKVQDVFVTVSWESGSYESAWQLVYGAPGFNPDTVVTPIDITTPSPYKLSGLTAETDYDIYLRTFCGETSSSSVWSSVLSCRTTPSSGTATLPFPYECGFEDNSENSNWNLATGSGNNRWIIGTSTHNGGGKSLYISNNGSAYSYSITATTKRFAYRTINIPHAGLLSYSFDWKSEGEYLMFGHTDYSLAFLVPSDLELDVDVSETVTPAGWIPLTSGPLEQNPQWQVQSGTHSFAEPGSYKLVFFWKNDFGGGTGTPAAIDNISLLFDPDIVCKNPGNFHAASLIHNAGQLRWTSDAETFDVKVSSAPIDPLTEQGNLINLTTVQDNFYDMFNLTASTPYYAYVRANCSETEASYWVSTSFTTGCPAVSMPFEEHFTGYGTGAGAFPTCWRYQISNTGNVSLPPSAMTPYIVDGTYSKPDTRSLRLYGHYEDMTTSAKTFAIMPRLDADVQALRLRFDSYSATTGAQLQVGVLTDWSDISTFEPVATYDLGAWKSHTLIFDEYEDTGRYIAFLVNGDMASASYTAFIDQIRVDSIRPCQPPISVNVSDIVHDGATITWKPLSSSDTALHIQISTVMKNDPEDADDITEFDIDEVVRISDGVYSYSARGLASATTYYLYVRIACKDNNYSDRYASVISFRTACRTSELLPFAEPFDRYGSGPDIKPDCWTVDGTAAVKPYCSTTRRYGTSGASLYFSTESGASAFAILPELSEPIATTLLSFVAYKTQLENNITVGVLTDPTDVSTFDSITTVSPDATNTWQEFEIFLNGYSGTGRRLAFRSQQSDANAIYIDNVSVKVIPACIRPSAISASRITDTSADITFVPVGAEVEWNLKIGASGFNPETEGTLVAGIIDSDYSLTNLTPASDYDVYVQSDCREDGVSEWRGPANIRTEQTITCAIPTGLTASVVGDSVTIDWEPGNLPVNRWRVLVSTSRINPQTGTADVADTLVTTRPVVVKGLLPSQTYYYYVQNQCESDNLWSTEASFTSSCPSSSIPFKETFSSITFPPVCWERYSGLAENVFGGGSLVPAGAGWGRTTSNDGISGNHTKVNFYKIMNWWLISPVIELDTTTLLLFDIALTDNGNGNPVDNPTGQPDDRFMVIVSADAGSTWSAANATVWDNNNLSGSDYALNMLSNKATQVQVDLSAYKGKNIRLAFYAESTVANGDNDLHIGNVEIATLSNSLLKDETCVGYDYSNSGFDIPATELNAGQTSYSQIRKLSEGAYLQLTLELTVGENKVYNLNETVCVGETYTGNGFVNVSKAGVYRRNVVSTIGCDSTVLLTLSIAQPVAVSSSVTISPSDLPFTWNGQEIAVGAIGNHHLVFHGKTAAGCDSTHTLTVSIGVDIPFTGTLAFNLLPNPIARGDEVWIEADFSAAERNGLTVEIFSSVGELIRIFEPNVYPVSLTGFDQNGVYLIRITTGKHEMYYGRLIVQ